ncbi:SDR family NAD(P)-dependent oxidoreductase [candidate division KSB1 bacterium]|nr:SDR family NAD(P)-dependent oxidoreductase [candidate division KSB1 bacterium]
MLFSNQNVIITGATGNLGRPVVHSFLDRGANVAAISRHDHDPELAEYAKNTSGNIIFVKADLSNESSVNQATRNILEKLGSIEILINIAGGFAGGKLVVDTELQTWNEMMNMNLLSVFLMSKAVMRAMMERHYGKIINISALATMNPGPKKGAYLVSKAGLNTLTKVLAQEGKEVNIQVNAIAPSIILTPANKGYMPDADHDKWVKPEAIADLIRYLCTSKNNDINGNIIEMPAKG